MIIYEYNWLDPPGHPSLPQPSEISSDINIQNIQAEVLWVYDFLMKLHNQKFTPV